MKNLANCTPTEFLRQTFRIKKDVEKWIEDVDLKAIRGRTPELVKLPENPTAEDKVRVINENRERVRAQGMENLSAILDAAMDKHPEDTLRLLALLCFIEPEDVDTKPMSFYLQNIMELARDKAVVDFFVLCYQLAQTGTPTA